MSRAADVHVVAATGLHQEAHCPPEFLAETAGRDLATLFTAELTEGIRGTGVRAGLIGVAGSFHGLDPHARRRMAAAAEAHHATGAPVAVHLELGTGALDVAELLCEREGVASEHVILGHLGRLPDQVTQRQVTAYGTWLAFDGPARAHHATDWQLADQLAALADADSGTGCCSAGTPRCPRRRACRICCAGSARGSNRRWVRRRWTAS